MAKPSVDIVVCERIRKDKELYIQDNTPPQSSASAVSDEDLMPRWRFGR